MIRVLSVLTALAMTAAVAAPASAASYPDSVTVNLRGKSVETAYADIAAAARTVCGALEPSTAIYIGAYDCVRQTVSMTISGLGNKALTTYARKVSIASM